MSDRTVTEQQVRSAFIDHLSPNQIICFNHVMDELFPELPKLGELIDVSDTFVRMPSGNWRPFHHIGNDGRVFTGSIPDGTLVGWKRYRRQTPTQKGA